MNKTLFAAFMASLTLAACSGGGGSADISGTGSLSIGVTDAPVDDAEAVVVTFTAVELLGPEPEDDSPDPVRERFELDPPVAVDLLSFQGTNSQTLVSGATVPVGTYDQVRFIVDAPNPSCMNASDPASFVTVDGTSFPLVVPSGAQTGLKVQGPLTVAAGGVSAFTIDFDLRKALAERPGGANRQTCYNLRPVLRVVDNAQVGSLTGSVDPALFEQASCSTTADAATGEGGAVYVYQGAGVEPTDVDGDGQDGDVEPLTTALLQAPAEGETRPTYTVGFLLAGDYTAAFTCQAPDDDPEASDTITFDPVADVTISADTETLQDFDLAPAEEETTAEN